jgi:hypothetical protein
MSRGAKPDGKRPSERVSFNRKDADRIAKTVRAYESGDKKGEPLTFGNRLQPNLDVFRLATFDGDSSDGWAVFNEATITFTNPIYNGQTAVAKNYFCSIGGGGEAEVGVARDISNVWHLISWPMGQACDTKLDDITIALNTANCVITKTLHTSTVTYLSLTFPYVTCSGQD